MNAAAVATSTSSVGALLDAREWAHTTQTFRALDFEFAFRCTDQALGRYFDETFAALVVDGAPAHLYSIVERDKPRRRRFGVFLDGRRAESFDNPAFLLHFLLWHINREAVTGCDALLFHASAVARGQRAAVFVAPMKSGKSTLATALVRAGYDYISDEAVGFDETGAIVSYPRPIALKKGSWPLFGQLRPDPAPDVARYLSDQWNIPADVIRPGAVAGPARAAVIASLRFDPEGETTVEPLPRSRAIPVLVQESFNFHRLGAAALERLASVVEGAQCATLTVNDLDAACATVDALLEQAAIG